MASIKSAKKAVATRKSIRKRSRYLELWIRNTKGKYIKLALPVEIVRVSAKTSNRKIYRVRIEPEVVLKSLIKIDNVKPKDFMPKSLRRKTIHLTRGNQKIEGTIIYAKVSLKGPEGEPVPNPPQPVH